MRELHRRLAGCGGHLVVAGDQKGPDTFDLPHCDFLSLASQQASGLSLAGVLPAGHYARKNIGYLQAIRAAGFAEAGCHIEFDLFRAYFGRKGGA